MKNFWLKLAKSKKPIAILAPMAGVTDFVFREIVSEIGKPDVVFTEFVSTEMVTRNFLNSPRSDLLEYHEVRPQKIPPILKFSKKQRPIMVQFFGSRPEQFEYCARLATQYKFDGIDINIGCPDRKVLKQGAGSELIKNPQLAREIIQSAKKGCDGKLPISVKTRLGYEKKDLEWIRFLLEQNIDALTIHGRTAKQGYAGVADWDMIGEAVKIRNKMKLKTLIIGNGDIKSREQARLFQEKYGVDGVMIGRQILHNPWIFGEGAMNRAPTVQERIRVALKHTKLFAKFYKSKNNFGAMKKYYKAYLSGVSGDLFPKKKLMDAKSISEAKNILKYLTK